MIPVFPALVTFFASVVGYPLPIVCTPLTQGTTISYTVNGAAYTTMSLPQTEGGWTQFFFTPPGSALLVTVAGQTISLPAALADTPATHELPTPAGDVAIPIFVAVDPQWCNDWVAQDSFARGQALLLVTHESMHAHWADLNEALTECRAMQAAPQELAALWPGVSDPGTEPDPPHRSRAWRRQHPLLWRRLIARWRKADVAWRKAEAAWEGYTAILGGVRAEDSSLPPSYHGVTC